MSAPTPPLPPPPKRPTPPGRPSVTLEVVKGPHAGERFEFDRHDTFVVGRSKKAHLRLKEDAYFSRHHFRMEIAPPAARLIDLDSRNGTRVNGERVEMHDLVDGDVISGGRTRIKVSIRVPASKPKLPPLPKAVRSVGRRADADDSRKRAEAMALDPSPVEPARAQGDGETVAWDGTPPPVPLSPRLPPLPAPQSSPPEPADSVSKRTREPGAGSNAGQPEFDLFEDDVDYLDVEVPTPPGYELHGEIGRGAMGVVYRATHVASGQECAVKVIAPQHAENEDSLALFIREASTLSQLDHPRIVRFREMGLVGRQMFLSMDYVRTITLEEILADRTGEDRTRIVVGIARQVLDGLAHAHERSLVHRDVKPENILVTRGDRGLVALLTDFGLAKNYQNAGFSGITGENEMRGSLAFMPPEQVRDARLVTPACDLYGVGATIYNWLTDRYPYDFENLRQAIGRILDEKSPPISLGEFRHDLPRELIELVDRSLAHDPADRFQSAEEMRRRLKPFARA